MSGSPHAGANDVGANPASLGCPHLNHQDPSLVEDDFFDLYGELREQPVVWSDHHGGFWVVSRFDDVRSVLKDWQTFSSAEGVFLPDIGFRTLALDQDPPQQTVFRRLFLPVGGRTAVEANQPKLQEMTRRVVSAFAAQGGGDAIPAVSEILPVEAIGLMAGLSPEASSRVRQLSVQGLKNMATDPQALMPLMSMLLEEVETRRGGDGSDFLTELANAEVDGRPITEEETGNILVSTVLAGHETTMNASGHLLLELAKNPTLQEELRADDAGIPRVVEESLRHRAPVHLFFRTVTQSVTVAGTEMKAGDKVAVLFASANRDPRHFSEPDTFRPDREDVGHVSFGWGIHRCIGAPLAQVELRLLVSEIMRHGRLVLAGEPQFKSLEGGYHAGVSSLPLGFEAA